jgi:hypothetical protein
MSTVGDIAFSVGGTVRVFRQLSVRECVNIQKVNAETRAQEAIVDGRATGATAEELRTLATLAREGANLASELLRFTFTTEGALVVVAKSVGSEAEAEALALDLTPTELTTLAYQLLGYVLIDVGTDENKSSKLVSRSEAKRLGIG